jgi:hypothetical protein
VFLSSNKFGQLITTYSLLDIDQLFATVRGMDGQATMGMTVGAAVMFGFGIVWLLLGVVGSNWLPVRLRLVFVLAGLSLAVGIGIEARSAAKLSQRVLDRAGVRWWTRTGGCDPEMHDPAGSTATPIVTGWSESVLGWDFHPLSAGVNRKIRIDIPVTTHSPKVRCFAARFGGRDDEVIFVHSAVDFHVHGDGTKS